MSHDQNIGVLGRSDKAAGADVTVARLAVSLVLLVVGALAMAALPLVFAFARIGYGGTALLVLGIGAASIGFTWAYERLTPASPPTPRRDVGVILFAALLIGLWAFLFTNEVGAFLVLGAVGAFVLLPEELRQRWTDRLPWWAMGLGRGQLPRSRSRRTAPLDAAAQARLDRSRGRARAMRWIAAGAWAAAALYAYSVFRPAIWMPVVFVVAALLIAIGGRTGRGAAGAAAILAVAIGLQLLVWAMGCALLCPSWIAFVGSAVLLIASLLASRPTADAGNGSGSETP